MFNVLTWVRYFPILSLLALGTASMATGLLYRDRALADLVTRGKHENIALAQTLTNSLGTQLQPMLQTSETGPQANLKREVQVQLLHQSILDQMQALPITRVKILDRQGTVLFSTDPAHLGQDRRHRQDVLAAQQGQVVTALDDPKTLADFPQTTAQRRMLSSAIPLRLSGQVSGVFELDTDVTSSVGQIHRTSQVIVLVNGLIWGLVYGSLLVISSRAAALLKRQQQTQEQTELAIRIAEQQAQQQVQALDQALEDVYVRQGQQMYVAENLAHLGQRLTGIAQQVNHPIHVLQRNVTQTERYVNALLDLLHTYDRILEDRPTLIAVKSEQIDRDFLEADFPQVLQSMRSEVEQVQDMMMSLQNVAPGTGIEPPVLQFPDGDHTRLVLEAGRS